MARRKTKNKSANERSRKLKDTFQISLDEELVDQTTTSSIQGKSFAISEANSKPLEYRVKATSSNSIPIGTNRGYHASALDIMPSHHQQQRHPRPSGPGKNNRHGPKRDRRDPNPHHHPPQQHHHQQHQQHPRQTRPPPQPKPENKLIIDPKPQFNVNTVGPHPGRIEPCRAFAFEHRIQSNLRQLGTERKDVGWRMQGVNVIDQMRKTLGLPTKTLNTAATIFHRFRLQHSLEGDYQLMDATAAALYLASKIEDTAKKPNQIVCAGYNINAQALEQRQPEDDHFDSYSDRVVELESLMLESTSFEFDTRHPQQLVVKILQAEFDYSFDNEEQQKAFQMAWSISMDLNYTFALLKQTTATLAIACVELAMRLLGQTAELERVFPATEENPYSRFATTREQISETQMDLLDLYTTDKARTFTGEQFSPEDIMEVKITLNKISDQYHLQRYSHWRESESGLFVIPSFLKEPKASRDHGNGNPRRENAALEHQENEIVQDPKDPNAPLVRRFILQSSEAVRELKELDQFFALTHEDYEKEHEVEDGWESYSEEEVEPDRPEKQQRP